MGPFLGQCTSELSGKTKRFVTTGPESYGYMEVLENGDSKADQSEVNVFPRRSTEDHRVCHTGKSKKNTTRAVPTTNQSASGIPSDPATTMQCANSYTTTNGRKSSKAHFRDEDSCRKGCNLKFPIQEFEGYSHMNKRVGV
ncbi:hypothetical protein CRE_29302 [Caenorhabditis remanei]|uniref:Uncharacterized protein n=1 Tax=Caenorhabditis remanei TaxID=31234 RepID=E3MXZ4_CAERE|nr:hypothetical protein CRE_29302 [Caenorhabditis remanei]